MAKEISTEILIQAPASKVWAVLTNFEQYPNWNPFIKSLQGEVKVGKTITVLLAPPQSKAMTFKPKVLVFEKEKEFKWLGHLLFKGLFDGAHRFELIDQGNGNILFRQSEKFTGILVPLFKSMLEQKTLKGFDAMNRKLKVLAEQQ